MGLAEADGLAVAAAVAAVGLLTGALSVGEAALLGAVSGGAFAVVRAAARPRKWRGIASPPGLSAQDVGLLAILGLALAIVEHAGGIGLPPRDAALALGAAALALPVAGALAKGIGRRRVVVVGTGPVAQVVARALEARPGVKVLGFVDDDALPLPDRFPPVLGRVAELERLVRPLRMDAIIVAFSIRPDRDIARVLRDCRAHGVAVGFVPRMFEDLDRRASLYRIGPIPLLGIDPRWHERRQPRLSRAIDVTVAIAALALALPLCGVIALAIKVESRGPVLYRARRVGFGGREFTMLKFRKMREAAAGPLLTLEDDDRLTATGRWLRRSKLDELPQLWNVLQGEMTLVGPRPEDPTYVALYAEEYRKITVVRPGLTGLSQIQYRHESQVLLGSDYEERYRSELLPDKITMDSYYVDRRTVGLDLRILCWTLVALVHGAQVERCPVTDSLSFRRNGRGP